MENKEKPQLKFDDVPIVLGEIMERLDRIEKKMEPIQPPALGPDPVFNITIDDAAQYLSFSVAMVRYLTNHGKLDFRKIGKRLYYSRDTLDQYVTMETLRVRKIKKQKLQQQIQKSKIK